MGWIEVEDALEDAVAITWDKCHKIYVLMDEGQVAQMTEYEYDPIIPVTNQSDALRTLTTWFAESCGLRFIESVASGHEDPNEGFTNLISQGEFDRFGEELDD
jgi:hypothetical protein